jgi:protein-tyrosine phosphatase
MTGYRREGVQTLVSLLEPQEAREVDLVNEADHCRAAGMRFLSFPIPDRGVPRDLMEFSRLVESLASGLRSGDSAAIHCRAGIGRSGLLGACVLRKLGIEPDVAFAMLGRARGVAVPDTEEQVLWVRKFEEQRR